MNTATQLKARASEGSLQDFDRDAAYRLRTAALQRHLIQERVVLADGARSRSVSEANSTSALAANDVGGADAALVARPVRSATGFVPGDSPLLYRTAGITDLVAVVWKSAVDVTRAALALWCRHQQARATHRSLRGLDPHLLRDIGMHHSVVVETARLHAVRSAAWRF